eukprot:COSAG04_NODE_8493_length_966_cov_2.296424_1_plen_99_part_10
MSADKSYTIWDSLCHPQHPPSFSLHTHTTHTTTRQEGQLLSTRALSPSPTLRPPAMAAAHPRTGPSARLTRLSHHLPATTPAGADDDAEDPQLSRGDIV